MTVIKDTAMSTLEIVRIAEIGPAMFLGPLEAVIMQAMWEGNTTSPKIWRFARENYKTVRSEEIAYTTVTTTLYRLADRGLIIRKGDKRAYTYAPTITTEAAFIEMCIRRIVWALIRAHAPIVRKVLSTLAQGE